MGVDRPTEEEGIGRAFSDLRPHDPLDEQEVLASVKRDLQLAERGPVHLGRYRLGRRLGAGGTGVVHEAKDGALNRRVAIKLVHAVDPWRERADEEARLIREARAVARLSHPNVIQVFDTGRYGPEDLGGLAGDEHVAEGGVYIVMELVDGHDLSAWIKLEQHPWRAVLARLVDAGRGLAAAHAAGIVHRDFKPANVLIGTNKEVRVTDFGLARHVGESEPPTGSVLPQLGTNREGLSGLTAPSLMGGVTRSGKVVGTPAYMAPEQHRGKDIDASSDQYAFCISLYECLFGARPFSGSLAELVLRKESHRLTRPPEGDAIPRAVWDVIVRGLHPDPRRRFPSMARLLAALDVARPRRGLRVALVSVGVVAVAAGAWLFPRDAPTCAEAHEKLAGVWDGTKRSQVRRALTESGVPYARSAARRAETKLASYAEEWARVHERACRSSSTVSELFDRQMLCLNRRHAELSALVNVLAEADANVAAQVTRAVENLTPASTCADEDQLLAGLPPPSDPELARRVAEVRAQLARGSALKLAGRFDESVEVARAAVAAAEAIDYAPVRAEAWFRLGAALTETSDLDQSVDYLERAFFEADGIGHNRTAAAAASMLVHIVAYVQSNEERGAFWIRHSETMVERLGHSPRAEARHVDNLGAVSMQQGRYRDAIEHFEHALGLFMEIGGPDLYNVGLSLTNIGSAQVAAKDFELAEVYLERGLRHMERSLGTEHPDLGNAWNSLATVYKRLGRHDDALAGYRESLALRLPVLGEQHPAVGDTLANMGNLYVRIGSYEEGRAHLLRALSVFERGLGPNHPSVGVTLVGLGSVDGYEGRLQRGRAYFLQAMDALGQALPPEHPAYTNALENLATLEMRAESYSKSRELFTRALELKGKATHENHPSVIRPLEGIAESWEKQGDHAKAIAPLERALAIHGVTGSTAAQSARTRFMLARSLWESRADRPRALELAHQARDGSDDAELSTELAAWLGERQRTP